MKNKIKNYCLDIAYDGTNYSGWQFQPDRKTIQSELEKGLKNIFPKQEIKIAGSGRTDANVHAFNQIATVMLESNLTCNQMQLALNGNLPNDIYVNTCTIKNNDFHARFSAKKREYIYYISNTFSPMNRLYSWNINWKLSLSILEECSKMILGQHNFTSFSKASSEAVDRNCEIFISKWTFDNGNYEYNIVGNRFLHHMVRFLVGTMIEVSRERYSIDDFSQMLNSKDGKKNLLCAPPQGLFLKNVYY